MVPIATETLLWPILWVVPIATETLLWPILGGSYSDRDTVVAHILDSYSDRDTVVAHSGWFL